MRPVLRLLSLAALAGASAPLPRSEPAGAQRLITVATAESLSVSASAPPTKAFAAADTWPTVVLLSGPLGSAFSMRHVTAALAAQGVATVVIDPLGMGNSSRPRVADYSLAKQARRVASVLDTLGIDRVLLVAPGTSATIALHLAADHPARVIGVISLSGGPMDQQGTPGVSLALKMAPLLNNALGRVLGRRKFMAGVREQSFSDAWCTKDVMRVYLEPFERDLRGALRALAAMSDAVEPAPIVSRLSLVTAPVQLLMGDKQSPNSTTDAQVAVLARGLGSFRVDTIVQSGTILHEERPDAVVRATLTALARPPR
jgi:pimeloyl-ACP methyl ester carboxylesterase